MLPESSLMLHVGLHLQSPSVRCAFMIGQRQGSDERPHASAWGAGVPYKRRMFKPSEFGNESSAGATFLARL